MAKGDLYQDGKLVLAGVEVWLQISRDAGGLATRSGTLTLPKAYTVQEPEHELVCNGKRYRIAIAGYYISAGSPASFLVTGSPVSE